jgi:hypothetical protein
MMWSYKYKPTKSVSPPCVILSEFCLSILRLVYIQILKTSKSKKLSIAGTPRATREIYLLCIQTVWGFKCNNIANLAHRLTCKCALSRHCILPLEFRAIFLCFCWVLAQILALFPQILVRPRRLCCRATAWTPYKTGLPPLVNHPQCESQFTSSTWMRCLHAGSMSTSGSLHYRLHG